MTRNTPHLRIKLSIVSAFIILLPLSPLLLVNAEAEDEFGDEAVAQLELILQDGVDVSVEVLDEKHGMPSMIVVPIDGVPYTIELTPHSVCSDDYKLFVQNHLGVLNAEIPGSTKTFRGHVVGIPGSSVGGGIVEDRILARIQLPGSVDFWLEPLDNIIDGVSTADYILYRIGAGAELPGGSAGATDAPYSAATVGGAADPGASLAAMLGSTGPRIIRIAEVAVDSDVQFFQQRGSVAAAEQLITALVSAANVQFERDVQIRNIISGIIVRTAEPDPYPLNHNFFSFFRLVEESIQAAGIPHDLGLFFSPLRMGPGGSAGLASGTLCSPTPGNGIAWVNPDHRPGRGPATIPYGMKITLLAHEMGHLWGANHFGGDTMSPSISFNLFFSPIVTIPSIVAKRDSAEVLACTELKDLGEEVNPVSMTVTGGTLFNSATVLDLDISDDNAVRVIPSAIGSKFVAELTLDMVSPHTTVSRFNITIESAFDVPGTTDVARSFVELWDFTSSRWKRVGRFTPSDNVESVVEIPVDAKATDYVDASNGAVRLRLRTMYGRHGVFQMRVDHIDVGVWP